MAGVCGITSGVNVDRLGVARLGVTRLGGCTLRCAKAQVSGVSVRIWGVLVWLGGFCK